MNTTTVQIKAFDGMTKEVKKIAIFAELDQKGNVFYKIEGQGAIDETSALAFVRNIDEAIERLCNITKSMLKEQTERLI